MISTRSFLSFFTMPLFVVACGGGATPAPTEPAAPVAPATPSAPEPEPSAAAEPPKPAASAAPAATAKTSALQIDGVSISDVTAEQLVAALKKRGWEAQVNPGMNDGKYEKFGVSGRKDKSNKEVVVVGIDRASKASTPVTEGSKAGDFDPKKSEPVYAKNDKLAQKHDTDAEALVSVMYMKGGSTAAAKTLLDSMLGAAK